MVASITSTPQLFHWEISLWISLIRLGICHFCIILYLCTCFAHAGPRVFLNCPLNSPPNHIEMWFINLWNHFIIPYLTATTLDGIKVCENV